MRTRFNHFGKAKCGQGANCEARYAHDEAEAVLAIKHERLRYRRHCAQSHIGERNAPITLAKLKFMEEPANADKS